MPVQPKSLKLLDEAHVPADQARAIVSVIEIEIDGARDTLATKQDVATLRTDLGDVRKDVDGVRREMSGLREGIEGKITGLRGELLAEIHISASRATRQLLAATLTLMSMLAGIFYFLLTHNPH